MYIVWFAELLLYNMQLYSTKEAESMVLQAVTGSGATIQKRIGRNRRAMHLCGKCRKCMVDMKRNFKSYDVEVIKYAGMATGFTFTTISLNDCVLRRHVVNAFSQQTTTARQNVSSE